MGCSYSAYLAWVVPIYQVIQQKIYDEEAVRFDPKTGEGKQVKLKMYEEVVGGKTVYKNEYQKPDRWILHLAPRLTENVTDLFSDGSAGPPKLYLFGSNSEEGPEWVGLGLAEAEDSPEEVDDSSIYERKKTCIAMLVRLGCKEEAVENAIALMLIPYVSC